MSNTKYYLTEEGLQQLHKKYNELLETKSMELEKALREDIPKSLHSDETDSEYLCFQEKLEFVDIQLEQYEEILSNAVLITPPQDAKERTIIHLGATVSVEINGVRETLTLVGSLESDPDKGKISGDCPLGKALLSRTIGESVTLEDASNRTYFIKEIRYPELARKASSISLPEYAIASPQKERKGK